MTTTDPINLMGALVDSVGRWGECCTEIQLSDAEAVLNMAGPRRHWIGRSKGFSKSRDVAALSLVALLTQFPANAQGYIAASDAEQAGLLRQSMAEFVNNTPELQGRVTVDLRKVSAPSGATLSVLAADSAGAHGLRPFWLVVDELANWPDTPRHRISSMPCGPDYRRCPTVGESSSRPLGHHLILASASSILRGMNRHFVYLMSTVRHHGPTQMRLPPNSDVCSEHVRQAVAQ